jgi:hypothetical protein
MLWILVPRLRLSRRPDLKRLSVTIGSDGFTRAKHQDILHYIDGASGGILMETAGKQGERLTNTVSGQYLKAHRDHGMSVKNRGHCLWCFNHSYAGFVGPLLAVDGAAIEPMVRYSRTCQQPPSVSRFSRRSAWRGPVHSVLFLSSGSLLDST